MASATPSSQDCTRCYSTSVTTTLTTITTTTLTMSPQVSTEYVLVVQHDHPFTARFNIR